MLKYAKIIDEETKEVQIGVGVNDEYYASIGMTEMEVEQAYNGNWYLKWYAPVDPVTPKEKKRIQIIAELSELDLKQIRSLAAKVDGTDTDKDLAILVDLEEQKAIKRQELKDLQGE